LTIKFRNKNPFNPINVNTKEQFYTICNNIESNAIKEDSIFMISSLSQTQNTINTTAYLALVFSEQRRRVLVVDMNLRQPSLHKVFNIDNSFGLTNLLLNREHKNAVTAIKVTEYLYCLPTGQVIYEPSALLALEACSILLEEWKEQFDVILLHTSDCLNTPDAQIIEKNCDAIVLVIQESLDKLDKVVHVKKQLESDKHRIIGTVIIS